MSDDLKERLDLPGIKEVSVQEVRDALDARDAEIARWHQWAARLYERCEEAGPDEYEYIRNELMETCRPYAERSGST